MLESEKHSRTTKTETIKKKIVLFSANILYVGPPLGLLSITKLLDLSKFDVKIITKNEFPNYEEEVLKQCKGALCLGISAISGFPLKIAKNISLKVKAKFPDLPIIWGGWLPTTLPEECLKEPYIDFICMGQGERAFSQFVDAVSTDNLAGLIGTPRLGFKMGGQIIIGERLGTEEIESLPDYNLDLIDWNKYLDITDFGKRGLRVITSYGCPHRCAFCCEPFNAKRLWKPMSAEKFIDHLKRLREKVDFDSLLISDNNFFVDEQRVIKIFQGLLDNGFNLKIGQANGRTNILVKYAPSTWELMQKGGLVNIFVGAESGNADTLAFINKDATVEDTVKLAKLCTQYGVQMHASVIVGLPTPKYAENKKKAFQDELNDVFDLYNKMSHEGLKNYLLVLGYGPLPFSPLYKKSLEFGFIPPTTFDGWGDYKFQSVKVPWLSKLSYTQVDVLNYVSMVIGMDIGNLLSSLPPAFSIVVKPYLFIFKAVCKWRFKNKFLILPIDMWLFYLNMYVFREINKVFKMISVTEFAK